LQDGWQTQRHAKKARKWDILAQRKMEIINQIDKLENDVLMNLNNGKQ
jgi:hypothetical protein